MASLPGAISRDGSYAAGKDTSFRSDDIPPPKSTSFNRRLAEDLFREDGHPGTQRRGGLRMVKESLPDFVDKLECAIAECMATFRSQAEEALTNHLRAIERVQEDNDLAKSKLVVENCQLREKLGLQPSDELQHVLFRPAPALPKHQSSQTESKALVKQESQALSSRNNEGGCWQPLLAWVPKEQHLGTWSPPRRSGRGASQHVEDDWFGVFPRSPQHRRQNQHYLRFETDGDEESDDGSAVGEGSDANANANFKLRGLWRASTQELEDAGKVKLTEEFQSNPSILQSLEEGEEKALSKSRKWYIINPDSRTRLSWDLLSLVMVSYDLVLLPLFAFDVSEMLAPDWITRLFWTFDMGMSCCTGFLLQSGIIEFDHRAILKRYMKTWFVPDVIIVGSDWAGLMFSSEQGLKQLGVGKMARLTRMTRAVRFLRLLRLLRMQSVLANLTERIQSDIVGLALYVGKLMIMLAIVLHYAACIWWAIGDRDTVEPTWVKESLSSERHIESQYLLCLHWAASQFLGGLTYIAPASDLERFYAVGTSVAAFIISLMVLGMFTAGLTKRHLMDDHGARRMATLKTYLRQNRVSQTLAVKICRNAKHAVAGDLTEVDVEILSTIAESLKIQLHVEMHSRFLQGHPLFAALLGDSGMCSGFVREICHEAMQVWHVACGSTIFELGEEPKEPKVYVGGAGGTLEYTDALGETVRVQERQLIAEPVLWTAWKHRGTLSAISNGNIAVIHAKTFRRICRKLRKCKREKWLPIAMYAKQFVMELNSEPDASDLRDQHDLQ